MYSGISKLSLGTGFFSRLKALKDRPGKVSSRAMQVQNDAHNTPSTVQLPRILFLIADTGGGHRAPANALKNTLERLYPGRFKVSRLRLQLALHCTDSQHVQLQQLQLQLKPSLSLPLSAWRLQIDIVDLWKDHTYWPYKSGVGRYSHLVENHPFWWRVYWKAMSPKAVHENVIAYHTLFIKPCVSNFCYYVSSSSIQADHSESQ